MFGPVQPDTRAGTPTQRNIAWAGWFTQMLVKHEKLRNLLPESPTILFFPEDDPDLCAFNAVLEDKFGADANLVRVRIPKSSPMLSVQRVHAERPQQFAYA